MRFKYFPNNYFKADGLSAFMLNRIVNLVREVTLGVSALLLWALILTLAGATVATFDGTLIRKRVTLVLDNLTLSFWIIASVSSLSLDRKNKYFLITPFIIIAAFILGPRYLTMAAAVMTLLSVTLAGFKKTLESLLTSIFLIEIARLLILVLGVYGRTIRGLEAMDAIHYSLYAPLTWVLPVLVYVTCLAPLARLALHLHGFKIKVARLDELQLPSRALLLVGVITGAGVWLLIYRSPLNPGSKLVGVDAQYYLHLARRLASENLLSVLKDAFCDRPLYVFTLQKLTYLLDSRLTVEIQPLLCIVFNNIAAYILVNTMRGDKLGGLAALLAPLTYTSTAGIYAGYYANWLALALSQLTVAAYITSLMKKGWSFPMLTAVLAAITIAVHTYTGVILLVTIALASLVESLRELKWRPVVLGFLATAFATLTVLTTDHLLNSTGGQCRVMRGASYVVSDWGFNRKIAPMSPEWWRTLSSALHNWMITAAYDPTDWIFTAVAALFAPIPEGLALISWLSISGALVLTGPNSILIHRALYSMPLAVTVAIGLVQTTRKVSGKLVFAVVAFKASYVLSYFINIL